MLAPLLDRQMEEKLDMVVVLADSVCQPNI
jgi:hypothetical protein